MAFLRRGAHFTHEQAITPEVDPKTAKFNKDKSVFKSDIKIEKPSYI